VEAPKAIAKGVTATVETVEVEVTVAVIAEMIAARQGMVENHVGENNCTHCNPIIFLNNVTA
jgi:predicted kinase